MTTIKIDGQDYELESLPAVARQQVEMAHLAEIEINRLQAQIAIYRTAHMAYGRAFREAMQQAAAEPALPAGAPSINLSGETIKFG